MGDNWWETFDLGKAVEELANRYKEFDRNIGGWLPGGAETQGTGVPVISGLEKAWGEAWNPTTEQLSAPVRDVPVLGGASRLLETGVNTWNQAFERGMMPFWGALSYENPSETQWREQGKPDLGQYDWQGNLIKGFQETPEQGLARLGAGWQALTGTPEQQQAGREKFQQLKPGSQILGSLLDPVNWLPGPLTPVVKAKKATEVARATKPLAELSAGERILTNAPKWTEEGLAPLEKLMPEPGNPLARFFGLTPKSRVVEAAQRGSDVMANLLVNAPDEVGIGKIIDAGRIGDVAQLGKTVSSYDGQLMQHFAKDFNPVPAIKKVQEEAVKAGREVNLNELKGAVLTSFADHALAVAKPFAKGAGELTAIEKASNWLKGIESVAFLGANPAYPVQNVLNNGLTSIAYGFNPFEAGGRSMKRLTQLGFSPEQSFGPQLALQGYGQSGQVGNLASRLPFTQLAQVAEKRQSLKVYAQSADRAFRSLWGQILGQTPMPTPLARGLAALDPEVASFVGDTVRKGGTTASIRAELTKLPGIGKDVVLPSAEAMLPKVLRDDPDMLAHLAPLLEALDTRLAKAQGDPQKIKAVADEVRGLLDRWGAQFEQRATQAGETVTTGGAKARGLVDLPNEIAKIKDTAFEQADRIFTDATLTSEQKIAQVGKIWDAAFTTLQAEKAQALKLAEGTVDQKVLDSINRQFANMENLTGWARTEQIVAYEKSGGNVVTYDVRKNQIMSQYKEAMAPAIIKANNTITDALVKTTYPQGVPANLTATLAEYQKLQKQGGAFDDKLLKDLADKVTALRKAAADETEVQAAQAAVFARREKLWAELNGKLQGMRQTLFPATEVAPVKPPLPKPVPKKGGVVIPPDELDQLMKQVPGEKVAQGIAKAVPEGVDPYLDIARFMTKTQKEALDTIETEALRLASEGPKGQMPVALRKQLFDYVDSLTPMLNDARAGAIKAANFDRGRVLLNYTHRYGYDNALGVIAPFAFWATTSGKNWLAKYLEQPGIMAMYYRYKKLAEDQEKDSVGFPDRLKGMFRLSIPGAPDWMGDLFIDPVSRALPFAQYEYPMKAAKWLKKGGDFQDNPWGAGTELMSTMVSPHPPIGWAAALATGRPQDIGVLLPATRQIKALTAGLREAFPEQVAKLPAPFDIPPGGKNIESFYRKPLAQFGISEYDQYDTYRGDRMLSDLASSGKITAAQANEAMKTHKGPIWDIAVQYAALEAGMGQVPLGSMALKAYPKGEEIARGYSKELNNLVMAEATKATGSPPASSEEAWNIVKEKGLTKKGTPIAQWYVDHPEYEVRRMATTPPAERDIKFQQQENWDILKQSIPSSYRKQLSPAEQAVLQKWYDTGGKLGQFTADEQKLLQSVVDKFGAASKTPEFTERQKLGQEIKDLIHSEFVRAGGPAGIDNEYDWLKNQGLTKKGTAIASWYAAHPGYSTGYTPTYSKGYSPTYGTSSGTSNRAPYTGTGVKIGDYVYYPTSRGGGGRTYTPYTPYTPKQSAVPTTKPVTAWAAFKKGAPPSLVKALSTYIKKGGNMVGLGPALWQMWSRMNKPMGNFDVWLRMVISTSGL